MAAAVALQHLYRRPLSPFTNLNHHHHHHHPLLHLSTLPTTPLPRLSLSSLHSSPLPTQSPLAPELLSSDDESEIEEEPYESETEADAVGSGPPPAPASSIPPPKLTVKEKKELVSYAHSLGKKLKTQQVGKWGVTSSVAASFVENLESNELLKIKVHNNCPTEFADAVKLLEESTGSVAIGQIGRSVILYRPSISKMKKKEEQAARMRKRKVWKPKPRPPLTSPRTMKGQVMRSRASPRRRSS